MNYIIDNGFFSQVFISFLRAFFSFLFAIILESMFTCYFSSKKAKNIFNSLIKELNELGNELKISNSHGSYFRYEFSVWKTVESSGELLSISHMKHYKYLVSLYSSIYFADLLEQQYFDLYKLSLISISNTSGVKSMLDVMDIKRKEKKEKISKDIESFAKENAKN
jgi:hypothetical protein